MINKIYYLCLFTLFTCTINAQIGIQTTTPQAQLDVTATDRGILIPRVALTSLTVQLPVTNPQGGHIVESTLVYHNGTNGITAGYYYWTGTKWQGIGKANETNGLQFFAFSGNSSSPTIDKSNFNMTVVNSGIWTGLLNDACKSSIRNGDNYTIMFTGTLVVETPGNFQLQSVTDDGGRIVIDDVPVLNKWIDQGLTTFNSTTVFLARGKHKIEFWFYENTGGDFMQFNWVQNANGTTGTVNASSFIIE